MDLSNLQPAEGSRQSDNFRRGRGHGSGTVSYTHLDVYKRQLVHLAVVSQLANKRQGTQKAKTRSEVSGGGRKPWKQKGTGHARQGSTRAPQWTGGGVVFAPTPRDYTIKLNKKERRLALKSALTSRVNENKFIVVDELKFDEIKTKTVSYTHLKNKSRI